MPFSYKINGPTSDAVSVTIVSELLEQHDNGKSVKVEQVVMAVLKILPKAFAENIDEKTVINTIEQLINMELVAIGAYRHVSRSRNRNKPFKKRTVRLVKIVGYKLSMWSSHLSTTRPFSGPTSILLNQQTT